MLSKKLRAISHGSLIIDKIFFQIVELIHARQKSGLTEIQVANFIRRESKNLGGQGMAFPPIVSFGSSSSEIHHKPSNKKIGKNNFLMLDYGVKISGYCSDFTRTLFLGQPTKLHENIYNLVLASQITAIEKVSVGRAADEIDFAARHVINQAGFGKYFNHGTGHGVGKKIHESPSFKFSSADVVKTDDVVTVEPGIYLPKKFGVRIEDMILVSRLPKIFSKVPKDFGNMIVKI
ncbi:MAG: M24 family metallopeptidase [Candidatus Doudnabacteria bacterium]|nr:M24 family metallopeptidase [Candidatus Doudnabacteria bacterium]